MKKWSKRGISLLLAIGMVFGMTACGDSGNSAATNAEAKKYVYRMADLETDLFGENSNVYGMNYVDGRIYVLDTQRYWDEMTGTVVTLKSVKEDGSDLQSIELYSDLRENPDYYMDETDDGNVDDGIGNGDVDVMPMPRDTTETAEEETEDTTEPETSSDESVVYKDCWINANTIEESGIYFTMSTNSYSFGTMGEYNDLGTITELFAYDLNGQERYRVVLSDSNSENYVYYNYIMSDKEGNLVLIGDSIKVLDAQGNPVSEESIDNSDGWMQSAFMGKDGKLCMIWVNNDYTKLTLKRYNLQTKSYEENVELPDNLNNYTFSAGRDYDITLTNNQGMFGYNIGDESVTQIFSYINSDIDNSNMNRLVEIGDGKILASYNDEETWATHLAVLTYVDPSEVPDKEVMTLACYYLDYNLRKRIVAYNKENEQYRIMVKDYSSYASMDDYNAGYTQLNNDILAGQVPDILVLDSYNMPVDSYIAKGVLADIGKMIEEDEEFETDDFMTNVFDAYRVDGKLYSVIPHFQISTVMAKSSLVGDTPGWTMDDLKALMAKYPEASVFGETMTRSNILWNILMYSGSRFVDKTTGKCNFDSEEFVNMLEFAAQFPEEFNSDDDNYWMNYESQWREGRTLLASFTISDFRNYSYWSQGYFGEPVTLIGFPTSEGNGAVVQASEQYGISAKSKHKDAAWDFLRYYLTPEYQKSDEYSWTMPVLKEAILERLEEAKERPYWLNEDGSKEYYDDTWYVGDQEIIINPLSDEDAQELFDYISSVNMAFYYDQSLQNIIEEEAAPFFAGQKTAEEVAKIIQSRAQVYISESR